MRLHTLPEVHREVKSGMSQLLEGKRGQEGLRVLCSPSMAGCIPTRPCESWYQSGGGADLDLNHDLY